MSLLEPQLFSVLEILVKVTVQTMCRVWDESMLKRFKESDSFRMATEFKAQLSAVLEMQVKEAVKKICTLFSDTSAVLHQHLTQSQITHDNHNLKRKQKQMAKRQTLSRRKQGLFEIPSGLPTATEERISAVSQSWRDGKVLDTEKPDALTPSQQQSTRAGEFLAIKDSRPKQSLENAIDNGRSRENNEDHNACRSGQVDVLSAMVWKKANADTSLSDVRETSHTKVQSSYWERERKFGCRNCRRTFSKLVHLRAHQALHTAVEKPLRLDTYQKCYTGQGRNKTFIHPRNPRSPERLYGMKKCLKGKAHQEFCSRAHSPQKHGMARSVRRQHSCDTCGKSFACHSNLYRHQRIHTGEKPFICQTCGRSFNQLNTLKSHERIHTGEKPYVCKSCGKGFSQATGLRLHDGRHTGQNGFSCVVCGVGSACMTSLKIHLRTHTEETTVSCRVCRASISSLNSLQSHQNKHGGSKSHSCSSCEKSFQSAGSLKIHERTHTGERPYSCSVCSRTFTQQNSLKSHQLSHTGERPFSCDVCSKGFSSAGNLRRHQRIHTGQKPYSCNICERRFTQLNTLKAHMYVHTGEKQYTCDKCGRSFGYQRNLKSHKCAYT